MDVPTALILAAALGLALKALADLADRHRAAERTRLAKQAERDAAGDAARGPVGAAPPPGVPPA